MNLPSRKLHCKICTWSTNSIRSITAHVKAHPSVQEFTCFMSTPESYRCKDCFFKTFSVANFRKHVKPMHNRPPKSTTFLGHITTKYVCMQCRFETYSALKRIRHSIETGCTRLTFKWMECNECNYKTVVKRDLKIHIKHRHKQTLWLKCERCDYKSKSKSNLEKHERNHEAGKKMRWFKCNVCEFQTKSRGHLKAHVLRKHTPEEEVNWLKCNECGFRAYFWHRLNDHILRRHTNKGDTASKIGKVQSNAKKYTDGKGVSWVECGSCKYKARFMAHLNEHVIRKHTDSKDVPWFECGQCNYRAKLRKDLNRHVKRKHAIIDVDV